jgi:internalin A
MSSEEGLRIARERIAREANEKTGFLDLGQLGLTELPEELFGLTHLLALNLGTDYLDDQGEWQECGTDIEPNQIEGTLGRLAALPVLQSLSLVGNDLSDLAALARLPNLQALYCWSTQVRDLSPLARLLTLQTFDCSFAEVNDLAPLAGLRNLQVLDCSSTR